MHAHRLIYSGKSKSVYETDNPEQVLLKFRDDATAFNAQKKASLNGKGSTNNRFNSFIMRYLADHGVATHFIRQISDTEALCRKMDIIPLEAIVRNYTAGNLAKRLGIDEGIALEPCVYELFYKNDPLGDPLVNESVALAFGWASETELAFIKQTTLKINDLLKPLFSQAGLMLVDFKLEFGRHKGQILLADEFTPDGCRIWDSQSHEKFDKDRFRRDLGEVIEHYQQVAQRLGIV